MNIFDQFIKIMGEVYKGRLLDVCLGGGRPRYRRFYNVSVSNTLVENLFPYTMYLQYISTDFKSVQCTSPVYLH